VQGAGLRALDRFDVRFDAPASGLAEADADTTGDER
jgi:hypothetical protein